MEEILMVDKDGRWKRQKKKKKHIEERSEGGNGGVAKLWYSGDRGDKWICSFT